MRLDTQTPFAWQSMVAVITPAAFLIMLRNFVLCLLAVMAFACAVAHGFDKEMEIQENIKITRCETGRYPAGYCAGVKLAGTRE